MTGNIHATAVVEPGAEIADNVVIGPYCVVGSDVSLAEGVELLSHVVVAGKTSIGTRTRVFPFASIGHRPQDLKYAGEPSTLTIGSDCTIREHVTINPGTAGGGMRTAVGDRCLIMIGVHVGHDCILGSDIILSNNVGLAGHCTIDDFVIMSGHAGAVQFVHIGPHAFVGGMSKVERDVIPFGTVTGNPAVLSGLNLVGLKRRGFDREAIHHLRTAYRMIFSSEGTLRERVEDAREMFPGEQLVQDVVGFITNADRALTFPANVPGDE